MVLVVLLSMLTEPRIIESAVKSFELSKMAYVESYGGLDEDLRGICGFQNTRVSGSPKKSPHQIAPAAQSGFLVFKYFKPRRG